MNRLPVCVGLTHRQIWQEFRTRYPELSEQELRQIHLRWTSAYAEACGSGKHPKVSSR